MPIYCENIESLIKKLCFAMPRQLTKNTIDQFGDEDAFVLASYTLPHETNTVTSEVLGWDQDDQVIDFYKKNKQDILEFLFIVSDSVFISDAKAFVNQINGLNHLNIEQLQEGMDNETSPYFKLVSTVVVRYVATWVSHQYIEMESNYEQCANFANSD